MSDDNTIIYVDKTQIGKKVKLPQKKEIKIVLLAKSLKISGEKK